MFTLLLAWINAAYDCGYHYLFIVTALCDVVTFLFFLVVVALIIIGFSHDDEFKHRMN